MHPNTATVPHRPQAAPAPWRWMRLTALCVVALSILTAALVFVPAAASGDGHAIRQIALSELLISAVLILIVARSGRDRKRLRSTEAVDAPASVQRA